MRKMLTLTQASYGIAFLPSTSLGCFKECLAHARSTFSSVHHISVSSPCLISIKLHQVSLFNFDYETFAVSHIVSMDNLHLSKYMIVCNMSYVVYFTFCHNTEHYA